MPQQRPARNMQRTTRNQFEILLSFLEENYDVLYPKDNTVASRKKYNVAWDVLTEILNSDSSGPTKSAEKWKKTLSDWKQYVKVKADKISSSENCKELFNPLEERLANLLGHTFQCKNGKGISLSVDDDCKSKPGSSSLKRMLDEEYEDESDDPESQYNMKKADLQKIIDSCKKKNKKQKVSREHEDGPSEILIEENEDKQIQARLVEAEEQKADALQRIATCFESIATSVEFFCHSMLQTK